MCGITGFIDLRSLSTPEILHNMTKPIAHRGPDGDGAHFIDKNNQQIGIGHRRLSIIDLHATGNQPMAFNSSWITFNGEIYNYAEIKKELTDLNHRFAGDSDTEVILHAYEQWGISCINRFTGMFAFFLYDEKNNTAYLVRDRAGVKPLFYYHHDGLFLFASELKSFHQHPGFKKEMDLQAVSAFIQYGHVPTPYCIFKHCAKVRPGHYIQFQIDQNKKEEIRYWNVYDHYNKPKLKISLNEAKVETERILKKAFAYRLIADVPVGVFLSGGYDSACVTALLQKDRTEKIKTFTIEVPNKGLNEAPFAKEVAAHLGTDHHEYVCSSADAMELISELPYFYDEPFADSSAIPTSLVCKMARKKVTVALSADGGDEVFAGYNRYDYLVRHGKKLNAIPGVLRSVMLYAMRSLPSNSIPILNKTANFHQRYEKLKSLLNDPSEKNIMLNLSRQWNDKEMTELVNNHVPYSDTYYMSDELKKEFFTPLSYMMAVDYQTYMLDDILQKVDRASMRFSLEAREPFIDHNIIEWCAQLPDDLKYHHGEKKYLLKEIVHDYIPKKMMERPKMGFAIPIEDWMQRELKDAIIETLSEKNLLQHGLFNVNQVNTLVHAFFSGKKEFAIKIWHFYMFQLWYNRWMVN